MSTIFKYNFFTIIKCLRWNLFSADWYSPFDKYICIAIIDKLVFNIEVLNLNWLLVLYVPRASSFFSIQFFVLSLIGWFEILPNKFIIFLIFHYYTITLNIRLSIIFCLYSGDIYLSLNISLWFFLPFWFVTVSELFCKKQF